MTPLPIELRPDNSHVVFAGVAVNGEIQENGTAAHIDPAYPDAWRQEPVSSFIKQLMSIDVLVALRCGGQTALLAKADTE